MKLAVFRHASYDTPWWAIPSPSDGRFHRAGLDTAQYLCLHPFGPAAEMLRHHIGPTGDPDDLLLNLWTAIVNLEPTWVDFDDCATYGLTPDELIGDDYAPTQALADTVRSNGANAMIVPSAALPGTHNLILFGVRLLNTFLSIPLAPEETPTGHLTDGARPPAEVAAHVRWRGTPHSAAEQWKAARRYDLFDDPPRPQIVHQRRTGHPFTGRPRELVRSWPNEAEIAVPGTHFLQEDSADEIGIAALIPAAVRLEISG